MLKVTVFTNDDQCDQITSFVCSHISKFEKDEISFHFLSIDDDMLKFIKLCSKYYLEIQIRGTIIKLVSNCKKKQDFLFRFDSEQISHI